MKNIEEFKQLKIQLELKRDRAVTKLNLHLSTCIHPSEYVDVQHKGNTGNFDPSADSYWTEYHCKLCDKKWRKDIE